MFPSHDLCSDAERSSAAKVPRKSLTLPILQSYYPIVDSLESYLSEILQPVDGSYAFLRVDDDPELYVNLLCRSYVTMRHKGCSKQCRNEPPMVSLGELLEKAQEDLLSKAKGGRTPNVLTYGYRIVASRGEAGRLGPGRKIIVNTYLNTIVAALFAPEWELLYHRIGEDAMFHLLTATSIFLSLPNDCLCQMTGEPIINFKTPLGIGITNAAVQHAETPSNAQKSVLLKRKLAQDHADERPAKRFKRADTTSSISSTEQTRVTVAQQPKAPADITFGRARLFYSRPRRIPHSNTILLGLPPKHVLNCLKPTWYNTSTEDLRNYVDPDPVTQAANTRHLSKYIFPRQYELSSPFYATARSRYDAVNLPDYSDRESEIKTRGSCKTPKRLRPVLPILDKLISMHGKCHYKALLDTACPSKVRQDSRKPLDSSIILEMMSEYSSQLRTQPNLSDPSIFDHEGSTISARGLSQAQRYVRNKPKFAEFACGHTEVFRYATLVTDAVIPRIFWGSDANYKLILQHIKAFISARRYETFTLHGLLQGLSTTECDWLIPDNQKQGRTPVSDSLKRRELMEDFLFWYFDSFLSPLLRTTFYASESSAFRNRILYFRQDDWSTLCAPLIEQLSANTFQKVDAHDVQELLKQRKLGFSFVRLLPKETGVRPIVNLRRRNIPRQGSFDRTDQSINQILQAAFQILTYEKEAQSKLLGASVFGPNEVYVGLKQYKMRLAERHGRKLPKLYFVKMDVQACFDTIEQAKLISILRDIVSEDQYIIQRFGQVNCAGSRVRRKFAKKAWPEDDCPDFVTSAAELAQVLRHTIFVDQVVYPSSRKDDILNLLEEHITENLVKIGNDYYRQIIGIPQGSVLSALLCSFFYGDLERTRLKFTEDPESVVLRLIDDYLLVTTSLPRAKEFMKVMYAGHPEYGCFVSRDKTLTNFDYDESMNIIEPRQRGFPWCGYTIDMKDLSVSTDYSRCNDGYLQDSLTVDTGRRPGTAFVRKMFGRITSTKTHIIYTDATLNSRRTVYLNIYQNFLLSAMKMHYYLRTLGPTTRANVPFLLNAINQYFHETFVAIRGKSTSKVAVANGGRCNVLRSEVLWLGTHAFHSVLSRKSSLYARLLKIFMAQLAVPRQHTFRQQFRGAIREGQAMIAMLHF